MGPFEIFEWQFIENLARRDYLAGARKKERAVRPSTLSTAYAPRSFEQARRLATIYAALFLSLLQKD